MNGFVLFLIVSFVFVLVVSCLMAVYVAGILFERGIYRDYSFDEWGYAKYLARGAIRIITAFMLGIESVWAWLMYMRGR